MQIKQSQWTKQWEHFKDDSLFLFTEWIYPNTLEDFKGKRVLDAGCGHGHHMRMIAPYAESVHGVDLNAAHVALEENAQFNNVTVSEGDLAQIHFDQPFDLVYSIGVIHHTDDPEKTFKNLAGQLKPGGKMIIWVYSHEGNFWNRFAVEGFKKLGIPSLPHPLLRALATVFTLCLYPFVYSIYLLPLKGLLPYYDYFENFRKLSFHRNMLNVYDKLNAPKTFFIKKEKVEQWFNPDEFERVHLSHYNGVSWRCSGIKK